MKNLGFALLVVALASPLAAKEYKSVTLMDSMCSGEQKNIDHPEDHKASCALKCVKSGLGAMIDGKYVQFDKKGNDLAEEAIKKTKKKDHLLATINGDMKDDKLAVTSLVLE